MILLAAIALAILVVPSPWRAPVIAAGGLWEALEAYLWIRWSQRRRARVGVEALIGATARATSRLDPEGHVRVNGELWRARVVSGAVEAGADVRVLRLEGLTLVVETSSRARPRRRPAP
jgi:membrane-bound ClpP family serine protease